MAKMSKEFLGEIDLKKKIEDFFTRGMELRRPYERQWWNNMAFFLGHQWIKKGDQLWRESLSEAGPLTGKMYMTENFIKTKTLRQATKILREQPILRVIPGSEQTEDREAALLGDKFLEYKILNNEAFQSEILNDLYNSWVTVCGIGWLRVYWDSTQVFSKPKKGKKEGEEVVRGDIEIDVVSPFEMLFDGMAGSRWDRIRRFMHVNLVEWDTLEEYYKTRSDGTEVLKKIEEADTMSEAYEKASILSQFNKLVSGGILTGPADLKPTDDAFLVRRFWEKKLGVWNVSVMVGDTLVEEEKKNPSENRGYVPYVPFRLFGIGNDPWGKTLLEDAIPNQKALNRVVWRIYRYYQRMPAPFWIFPKGSDMADQIHNETEVVEYEPNLALEDQGRPYQAEIKNLPGGTFRIMDFFRTLFDELMADAEVARGKAPAGVKSGIAVNLLQEKDQSTMARMVTNMESSLVRVGKIILSIAGKKYGENRLMQLLGEDNRFNVISFKGADFRGHNDVRIQPASALPASVPARQAFLLQVAGMGGFGPIQADEKARATFFKSLGMLQDPYQMSDRREHENQAKEENVIMTIDNKDVEVEKWHNDIIHWEIINKLRMSSKWRKFPDPTKERLNAHAIKHEEQYFEKNKASMTQMMAQEGIQAQIGATGKGGGAVSPTGDGSSKVQEPSLREGG